MKAKLLAALALGLLIWAAAAEASPGPLAGKRVRQPAVRRFRCGPCGLEAGGEGRDVV